MSTPEKYHEGVHTPREHTVQNIFVVHYNVLISVQPSVLMVKS